MCKNIFVIDDCPINLAIAKMIIKNQGYFEKVSLFLEARKALDYIIENRLNDANLPDYILLDLNMPCMDGWHFLDMFEKVDLPMIKPIDVFILSSSLDERDVQRSERHPSVKGFFSKPLNVNIVSHMAANNVAAII